MKKIKNLIFDFGGVLYDIDIERGLNSLKNGGLEFDLNQSKFEETLKKFEQGLVDENEFVSFLVRISGPKANSGNVIHAFNQVLTGLNPLSLQWLGRLKKHYNLYLLSNTNSIHFRKFSVEILENPATSSFYNCFIKEYYSFSIKLRKPEPEIYNFVIRDSGIDPDASVFIDDNPENVEGAEKTGIHGFVFNGSESWEALIGKYDLDR